MDRTGTASTSRNLSAGRVRRRRGALAAIAATLAVAGAAAGTAGAAPGDLDRTYANGTGKSLFGFGTGADDQGRAVAVQPDGRIIVAGWSNAGGDYDMAVARLRSAQGDFDPTFGGGTGRSLAGFAAGSLESGSAVALQPDGRIVVAGGTTAGGNVDFAVARLRNPQGDFDPAFGLGTGRSYTGFAPAATDQAEAVALQPDGAIVVAGTSNAGDGTDFAVARLRNPQGDLDPAFGGGTGRSLGGFAPGSRDSASAVALQPDGRIVVAGETNVNGDYDFAVARLRNPDGTFDPTFNGTGRAVVRFGAATSESVRGVAVQRDGRIVVAGTTNASGNDDFAVARLEEDGTPDQAFGGGDGRVVVEFPGVDQLQAMLLQPDGKIILAGSSGKDASVMRLRPDGRLDTAFGVGGRTLVNFGADDESANAVALAPNGAIVMAGTSNSTGRADIAVARLEGDPQPAGGRGPVTVTGGGAGGGGTGGGTRRPTCAGRTATIVGTAAADRLTGTPRLDVIVGLGGADRISGLGGADIVCAGAGDDVVRGGAGADLILGGAGRDTLIGGPGADRLRGGPGRDRELR
ncbi:MAG: hypothetical protein AB7O78_02375 [Thermoleophilia bacterium]